MKDNEKNLFGGFDAISSMLMRTDDGLGEPIAKPKEVDIEEEIIDPDDKSITKTAKPSTTPVDDPDLEELKPKKVKKPIEKEEDVDDEEEVDLEEDETETDESDEEISEYEEEVSKYFATDLSKKLNIDLPEKFEAKKLEDVVGLMIDVIKANSEPTFANDEIAALNKFVEEGGDIKAFYKDIYIDTVDPDKLDIENERDQKAILKEHLSNSGYKPDRITKAIERYEDAGVLKDEAEEALELVKEARQKKAQKLLVDQEKLYQDQLKAKQQFTDTVYNTVEKSNDILGIPITKDEKKEMLDYIFKQDRNGMSQMVKELQTPEAQVNDLLERAFIKKFKNKLINESKKQGADDAYKKVRNTLKAGKGKSSAGGNTSFGRASSSTMSDLSSLLIGK